MKTDVLQTKINNRRYLGNKYKLLPFITSVIQRHCGEFSSFADLFAGTGAVASAYMDKHLITNDILFSNYITNTAWFSSENFNIEKLSDWIAKYNNEIDSQEENYMTENFSETYFSREVCSKIGFVREDIERKRNSGVLNFREYAVLLTSLLYGIDRIANTCGHYDAFRRDTDLSGQIFEMRLPNVKKNLNPANRCYNVDTNYLACSVHCDIVYLDPPYNSRQYCDAYHLVENVARWEKPKVFGIAKKMDRQNLKSRYCTREAPEAFADLIDNLDARFILVSYNNMAQKGNDRSNARITDGQIFDALQERGDVQVFAEEYRTFTTGKSNRSDNQERLFLCKCRKE